MIKKNVAWAKFVGNQYIVTCGRIVHVCNYPEVYLFAKKFNANVYIVNTGEFVSW